MQEHQSRNLGDDGSGGGQTETRVTPTVEASEAGVGKSGSRNSDSRGGMNDVSDDRLSQVGLGNGDGHWVRLVDDFLLLDSLLGPDVRVLGGGVGHFAQEGSAEAEVERSSRSGSQEGENNHLMGNKRLYFTIERIKKELKQLTSLYMMTEVKRNLHW